MRQRYLNLLDSSALPSPEGLGGSIRTLLCLGLLAVTSLLPQFNAHAQAADPRIGTWTLLSAQGRLDPPNRLTISSSHDGLHVVMTGEKRFDFTVKTNGHDGSAPGNLGFDSVELHRIDKRQAEVREKKNGALVATVHQKLSQDGNELTTTTTMPGKPDQITVWTRTGGKKAILDLFAGEWTQDLGKSRMKQGLPLKIEADGRGGVRFLWDYSYTAKLDGKPYDLKN